MIVARGMYCSKGFLNVPRDIDITVTKTVEENFVVLSVVNDTETDSFDIRLSLEQWYVLQDMEPFDIIPWDENGKPIA